MSDNSARVTRVTLGKIDIGLSGEIYFDRQGKPITLDEYGELWRDLEYKLVEQTNTPFGLVSTVWLGINHEYRPDARPVIFETMIFDDGSDWGSEYQERYSTEAEAKAGHIKAMHWLTRIAVHDGTKWRQPNV